MREAGYNGDRRARATRGSSASVQRRAMRGLRVMAQQCRLVDFLSVEKTSEVIKTMCKCILRGPELWARQLKDPAMTWQSLFCFGALGVWWLIFDGEILLTRFFGLRSSLLPSLIRRLQPKHADTRPGTMQYSKRMRVGSSWKQFSSIRFLSKSITTKSLNEIRKYSICFWLPVSERNRGRRDLRDLVRRGLEESEERAHL